MIFKMRKILIILLLSLFSSSSSWAEVDELQINLLKHFKKNLPRWNNLTGDFYWLGGVKPQYSICYLQHEVTLNEGQFVLFKVLPGEVLKIVELDNRFKLDEIQVYVANVTGLFREISDPQMKKRSSIAIKSPDLFPSLVYVKPKQRMVKLGFYMSDERPLTKVVNYPEEVDIVSMDSENSICRSGWFYLGGGKVIDLTLEDFNRLKIDSQFVYPYPDMDREQEYQLFLQLNNKPYKNMYFVTKPDPKTLVTGQFWTGIKNIIGVETDLGKTVYQLGSVRTGYISTISQRSQKRPKERSKKSTKKSSQINQISIGASTDLCIRLSYLSAQDNFLFPQVNQPYDLVPEIKNLFKVRSVSEINLLELQNSPTLLISDAQRMANHLAKNNLYQQGGLVANQTMPEFLFARSFPRKYRLQALQHWRSSIRYENLIVKQLDSPTMPVLRRFFLPSLKEERDLVEKVSKVRNLKDLKGLFSKAYFQTMPNVKWLNQSESKKAPKGGPDKTPIDLKKIPVDHQFDYKSFGVPSQLRILIDRQSVSKRVDFSLQFNDNAPLNIFFDSRQSIIAKSEYLKIDNSVLVAHINVTVPSNTSKLSVISSPTSPSFRYALQFQTSKTSDLSSHSYRSAIQILPDPLKYFQSILMRISKAATSSEVKSIINHFDQNALFDKKEAIKQSLLNQWSSLLRYFRRTQVKLKSRIVNINSTGRVDRILISSYQA